MLKYKETDVVEIQDKILEKRKIQLFVKREDQNHESISGNKWWKLKYNLEEALQLGKKMVLTFGGAFSNHIYATAAASNELGLESIGIIRGEETLPLNETLAFAKEKGMVLHYISREDYKQKSTAEFLSNLQNQFGDFYLIPEGGTNQLAVRGCSEFAKQELSGLDFDCLCLPVGTGGTMAGIIAGLEGRNKVIGFSVLKNGEFLSDEIKNLVQQFSGRGFPDWRIETNYHFGGYAKQTDALNEFILEMKSNHNLPLDFVYTAKMMAGVFDLISKNEFPQGSKILALHTGGLRPKSLL